MGDIANAFESMMTPPGTNSRRDQEDMIKSFAGNANDLASILGPLLKKQLEMQGGLMRARQGALGDVLANTGNAAREGRVNKFSDFADSQAKDANQKALMNARQAGLGDGGMLGQVAGNDQQAARMKNQYRQQQFSPEAVQQEAQSVFNALNGYNQGNNDLMNWYGNLFGIVNGQQPVQVGKGFGDSAGQLAQLAAEAFK